MGNMTTYMFLMFAVSFALYLGGYDPAFMSMNSQIGETPGFIAVFFEFLFENKIIVGVTAAAVTALVLSGSSLARSVAMLIVFGGIINIFLVPRSMWESALLPYELKIGITLFFNILIFLIAMELMTERDV